MPTGLELRHRRARVLGATSPRLRGGRQKARVGAFPRGYSVAEIPPRPLPKERRKNPRTILKSITPSGRGERTYSSIANLISSHVDVVTLGGGAVPCAHSPACRARPRR